MTVDRIVRKDVDYNIETDGIVVWVNGREGCIGRFSQHAAEVSEPRNGVPGVRGICRPTTYEDWTEFCAALRELYDIHVPNKYMPRRFKS